MIVASLVGNQVLERLRCGGAESVSNPAALQPPCLMDTQNFDSRLIALLTKIGHSKQAGAPAVADAAFRELYDLSASRMYSLALRVVGQREWAEDVLQEAYLYIWRTCDTYSETLSPPLAWMGIIVRSRALDFLRRRSAQGVDRTVEIDSSLEETLGSEAAGPADLTEASEQAAALHACLQRLEARQREVLSLAYLRDLSHAELAHRLSLPIGTVKTWIRRGIDQLRGCLGRFA